MIKPYNRHELYIAALSDSSLTIPDMPYTREETYLAKINGASVTLPDAPVNRYETYLAKLAGEDVQVPIPASRLEFFLYKACGGDVQTPTPVSREEMLWDDYIDTLGFRITSQPEDATVEAGQSVRFRVSVAGGTEPYSYQWYYRPSAGVAWTKVSASSGKTATYTLTTQSRHNGNQYYCNVTDDDGATVDSNIATLTVTSA